MRRGRLSFASRMPRDADSKRTDAVTTATLIESEREIESETERERVLRWRCEELHRAGYGEQDALLLAHKKDVDLHQAIGLLARGCPEETALLILF